jgi:hypothetical protein
VVGVGPLGYYHGLLATKWSTCVTAAAAGAADLHKQLCIDLRALRGVAVLKWVPLTRMSCRHVYICIPAQASIHQ